MQKKLTATLHAHWFNEILQGRKKIEYREQTDYWAKRLLNSDGSPRHYDTVLFRNGYAASAPVMVVEYCGLTISDDYEIHLGRILQKTNIENLNPKAIERSKREYA